VVTVDGQEWTISASARTDSWMSMGVQEAISASPFRNDGELRPDPGRGRSQRTNRTKFPGAVGFSCVGLRDEDSTYPALKSTVQARSGLLTMGVDDQKGL
jgi:hypothetical protein